MKTAENTEAKKEVSEKEKEWARKLIQIYDETSELNINGLDKILEYLDCLMSNGKYQKNVTDISWYRNRA